MHTPKFIQYYVIASGSLGFYRGWIADYECHRYSLRHEPVLYSLTTNRFVSKTLRGVANMCLYISIGHPEALYRLLCRVEISMTHKNPYDHMYAYREFFDFVTLPPKKTHTK